MTDPDFRGKSAFELITGASSLWFSGVVVAVARIGCWCASASSGGVFNVGGGTNFWFALGSLRWFVCWRVSITDRKRRGISTPFFIFRS